MFSHRFSRPSRQRVHWPHQRDGLTATRVSDAEAGDAGAEFHDFASYLVAQDQRRGHDEVARARVPEVVHVRSRRCRRRRTGCGPCRAPGFRAGVRPCAGLPPRKALRRVRYRSSDQSHRVRQPERQRRDEGDQRSAPRTAAPARAGSPSWSARPRAWRRATARTAPSRAAGAAGRSSG